MIIASNKINYYASPVASFPSHFAAQPLDVLREVETFTSPTERFMRTHSLFRINQALRKFQVTGKDLKLFKTMIAEETKGFLGYQAGSSTVRLFQDILGTIVRDILQIPIPDDFFFMRVPGEETFSHETAADFLREKGQNISPQGWDNAADIRQHILSLNMNLYQSFDADWDLTPRYYLQNTTWTHANVRELIKPFFASLGIEAEAVDALWSQALDLLSHNRGYIVQFFDESDNYDFSTVHSYIAYSGGKPHPHYRNHEILFDDAASNFPQIRLVMGNESSLNPFSALKMKRYDDMSAPERIRYEARLSALLATLPFDLEKVAAKRECLLRLWKSDP